MSQFTDFNLLESLQTTLAEKGLITPTEIQQRAIPELLNKKSVVGVAETGSGKTLAFALPILHLLKTLENDGDPITAESQPRAAVIVPTRELGEQVTRVFKPFTHTTRLRVRSVLGGTDLDVAKKNLKGAFEVLVATPGRLVQLTARGLVKLHDVRVLVFDEADQMLDRGFLADVGRIRRACAVNTTTGERNHPTMALFSATVPPTVEQLIQELFQDAVILKSKGSHRVVRGLTTQNLEIQDGKRFPVLEKLLASPVAGGTMIFTNTREQCDALAVELKKIGQDCVIYRGEMDKLERRRNLKTFREQKIQVLVSTDLASRGLDLDHVGRVVNYHMPKQMENYIHRVGRTARAGRKGLVVNLITERDENFLKKIKRLESGAPRAPLSGGRPSPQPDLEWPEEPVHRKPVAAKIIPVGALASSKATPKSPKKSPSRSER
jgi:ATP-dependent RNA helicase RhlE